MAKKGSNLTELARVELGGRTYLFGRGKRTALAEPDFFCVTELGRSSIVVAEVYMEDFSQKLKEAIGLYGPVTSTGGSICPGFRDRKWREEYSKDMRHALVLHPPKPDEGGSCETCGYSIDIGALREEQEAALDAEGICPGLANEDWMYIREREGSLEDQPELFVPHPFEQDRAVPTYCDTCTFDKAKVSEYEDQAREMKLSRERKIAAEASPARKRKKGERTPGNP